MIAASASSTASTLSCFSSFGILVFHVLGIFVFRVFGCCSLLSISWSIGLIVLFILVISSIGGILRCFIIVGRFLFFSFVTSCRCISLRTIASSISCSVTSSVIRCILISLHVGDQISWVRTVMPFLWHRQSGNIEKQE